MSGEISADTGRGEVVFGCVVFVFVRVALCAEATDRDRCKNRTQGVFRSSQKSWRYRGVQKVL